MGSVLAERAEEEGSRVDLRKNRSVCAEEGVQKRWRSRVGSEPWNQRGEGAMAFLLLSSCPAILGNVGPC
eukprot:758289-Hanusia_phi.AAC.1